jgi:hypothetical protein
MRRLAGHETEVYFLSKSEFSIFPFVVMRSFVEVVFDLGSVFRCKRSDLAAYSDAFLFTRTASLEAQAVWTVIWVLM